MYLKEVEIGKSFDENNYFWGKETIRENSVLSMLEESTGLKIALAVKYAEYGDVRSIVLVTTDRKHYEILYKKGEYDDKLKEYFGCVFGTKREKCMKNETISEILLGFAMISICIGLYMAYKPLVFIFLGVIFTIASLGYYKK